MMSSFICSHSDLIFPIALTVTSIYTHRMVPHFMSCPLLCQEPASSQQMRMMIFAAFVMMLGICYVATGAQGHFMQVSQVLPR